MIAGRIDKGSSTTLLGLWQNLNKEDPPIKEDFFNAATGVPQVLESFLRTVSSTPLDQMIQADTVLVEGATNEFFSLYTEAIREEAVNGDVAGISNTIRRRIAQQITKELQEIYTTSDI